MYVSRIPWELVIDPLGSAEHTLEITRLHAQCLQHKSPPIRSTSFAYCSQINSSGC